MGVVAESIKYNKMSWLKMLQMNDRLLRYKIPTVR